ncbi:hypothetical protein BS78_05G207600 [Paspalum vaginatum]|nr:hypothetical protein BS78_05G207600 [Paspalum vaginatum]
MVVMFMVQKNFLSTDGSFTARRHRAVWAALFVDMISLIVEYAAGCCRDLKTSIYVMALAGAAVFYIVLHMAGILPPSGRDDNSVHRRHTDTGRDLMEEKRKLLLELAVLAATLTYQAGLTPPGGFWLESLGHRAGDPVLLSNYPSRYKGFFYLNATSFMASVALTIILLNPRLYRHGIRCHALCVCMVAGLLCLMGAYAAGSSRHIRTTIFMITLIALVFIFIILLLLVFWIRPNWIKAGSRQGGGSMSPRGSAGGNGAVQVQQPAGSSEAAGRRYGDIEPHTGKKYLILLGVLAASITYQAGLVPPGGV